MDIALGMAWTFHTGVVKKLNLNVRKFWDLVPTFVGVTVEKLVVGVGVEAFSLGAVRENFWF